MGHLQMKRKRLLWFGLVCRRCVARGGWNRRRAAIGLRQSGDRQGGSGRHPVPVSGTGQIKPKVYANVGAETIGRITHLYVKEGDHVKSGQVLATMENVQPAADVATQEATIQSSKTDMTSYVAAEKTAEATWSAQGDLEQKDLDWKRGQSLYENNLIPKSDYDTERPPMMWPRRRWRRTRLPSCRRRRRHIRPGQSGHRQRDLRRFKDVLNRTVAWRHLTAS